jgi:sterol desaturase/sphingolipid hydroxylase (fatty acid hydroxylase superfamily)
MHEEMPELVASASLPVLAALIAAFFGFFTLAGLGLGFAAERSFPRRKVMDVAPRAGQARHEIVGNAVFVGVTVTTFTAALWGGWARFGEPTALATAATFMALVLGFQVFYWFLHRAMHTKALLWMHRWHHESQVTSALSGQSVSLAEAAAWMLGYVGLPVAMSHVVPISFWGWAGYMAFNVFGNVFGHANVELSGKASGTRLVSALANPWVYHALHHARWTGHYGFQAALMDRIFGTEYADWPALFTKILRGSPMKSLKERGDAASS